LTQNIPLNQPAISGPVQKPRGLFSLKTLSAEETEKHFTSREIGIVFIEQSQTYA
jgi:hypothetical protein